MTKLAEQMIEHQGDFTRKMQLANLAISLLQKRERNAMMAHDAFWERVSADPALLLAFIEAQFGFEEATLKRAALDYLQARRADMVRGPASKMDGGKGHPNTETQFGVAPLPSSQLQTERHLRVETHSQHVPSLQTNHSGVDHILGETQLSTESPAVTPNEPSAATIAGRGRMAKVIAISILDTHRLSNGVAIGDVYWGSIPRMRAASARDAALLRILQNMGHQDPHKKVRDTVTVEVLKIAIQKAAEISDAM